MRDFFLKKAIAALILTFFIFVFSFLNFRQTDVALKEIVLQNSVYSVSDIHSLIRDVEAQMNANILGRFHFVEAFGYLHLLMNKNEISNFQIIKDREGYLHFASFSNQQKEVGHLAERVNAFKAAIQNKDAKFLYLLTPDRYIVGQTKFDRGLPVHFENETADELLRLLDMREIENIDLRASILEKNMFYTDIFFQTSPYWTIEGSFWAFTELVDILNQRYNMNIDEQGIFTDIDNYNVITYPNSYVGILGSQIGKYYSGVDNFSIIFPKFLTDFDFSTKLNSSGEEKFSGSFEDVLISSYNLRSSSDPYNPYTDKYFSYLFESEGISHIKNNKNTDGMKLVVIKDSMLTPVVSFLSTVSSEIYFVDLQNFDDDILEFINDLDDLDFVILSSCTQNIAF